MNETTNTKNHYFLITQELLFLREKYKKFKEDFLFFQKEECILSLFGERERRKHILSYLREKKKKLFFKKNFIYLFNSDSL